jgi:hypothetical protein
VLTLVRAACAWRLRGVATLLAWSAAALAQAAHAPAPATQPMPSLARESSIAASIAPAVERWLREHGEAAPASFVPTFPVSVELGPRYCVADTFQDLEAVPRPVAVSPYGTPVAGLAFDPLRAFESIARPARGSEPTLDGVERPLRTAE